MSKDEKFVVAKTRHQMVTARVNCIANEIAEQRSEKYLMGW